MKKIELIGSSGSGKSTARRIFSNYLKTQTISCKIMTRENNYHKSKKIFCLLVFILKNLDLTLYILNIISKAEKKTMLLNRFLKNFYFNEIEPHKSLAIFDAGFLHMGAEIIINLNLDENLKKKKLIEYCNKTLKPDLIFYIKTDWKIAKKRMLKRKGHMFLKRLDEYEVDKYYKQYTEYFEIITREMKKNNIEVIEITNNSDLFSLEENLSLYFNKIVH